MDWKELLKKEIEACYKPTFGLLDKVSDDELDWKPSESNNWMTVGQLLMHITNSCGASFKGFISGDWGMPEGVDIKEVKPEEMLPPAEKLPTIVSVGEAKRLLAEDKKTAIEMLDFVSENDLANKFIPAPWDPTEKLLGHRLLQMIEHLGTHKSQLFYYLKIQGKSVNTADLWGM